MKHLDQGNAILHLFDNFDLESTNLNYVYWVAYTYVCDARCNQQLLKRKLAIWGKKKVSNKAR